MVVKCPKGNVLVKGKCIYVKVPPKEIDPHWYYPWLVKDPKVPIWNPPDYFTHYIDDIYDQPPLNYFNDGILGISATLGYNVNVAVATVKDVITEGGAVANGLVDVGDRSDQARGLPAVEWREPKRHHRAHGRLREPCHRDRKGCRCDRDEASGNTRATSASGGGRGARSRDSSERACRPK